MAQTHTPTVEQLKRALEIAQQIENLEAEMAQIVGTRDAAAGSRRGGRRNLSPEARARIVAAQKARWSKVRKTDAGAENGAAAEKGARKARGGKRKMSPATRAKMAEAARKRWAKKREGKA
jgi:hypothetical protein